MPLQNRVTPWGEIVALPERGQLMGNRGCLHDAHRRVVKRWARVPWITCLLQFGDRQREVMTPGQYTELFFLDEATALAAGHRPCATCRRADYNAFKAFWLAANPDLAATADGTMASIDELLHAERVDADGRKRTWSARLGELPDGTMMVREGTQEPLLVQGGAFYPWTPAGYGPRQVASPDLPVRVLTPPSVVKALAQGYRPAVHSSVAVPVPWPGTPAPATENMTDRVTPIADSPAPLAAKCADTAVNRAGERLFRLEQTPAGKALYTYFAAVLIATEMDQGAVYPLKRFLKNFGGHEQAGRIERVPGGHRLTRAGRDYFADRYQPGNPQHVDRREVEAMLRLVRTGKAPGWVPAD